jgi:prepilin-type N-terminal cleavage/methylation domain-containing protein
MIRRLNQDGFTLIEIIISLVLIGIIAAFSAMGVSSIVNGFLITRANAATTQKGQLAMARLVTEFKCITSVDSAASGPTSITFTSYRQGVAGVHVVSWTADTITMDGDILTDNVAGLDLGYFDSYSGAKQGTWASSRRMIQVTLSLKGANNAVSVFTDRVIPRNL